MTIITFLNHVINKEGVFKDRDKVTAVSKWLIPTTVKELQMFLGFINFYHQFISSIAMPLTALLKKGPKKLQRNSSAD